MSFSFKSFVWLSNNQWSSDYLKANIHERSSKCGFNMDLANRIPRKVDRVLPKINHGLLGDKEYSATLALVESDKAQMFDVLNIQWYRAQRYMQEILPSWWSLFYLLLLSGQTLMISRTLQKAINLMLRKYTLNRENYFKSMRPMSMLSFWYVWIINIAVQIYFSYGLVSHRISYFKPNDILSQARNV